LSLCSITLFAFYVSCCIMCYFILIALAFDW
jgi:hypothetical protein